MNQGAELQSVSPGKVTEISGMGASKEDWKNQGISLNHCSYMF